MFLFLNRFKSKCKRQRYSGRGKADWIAPFGLVGTRVYITGIVGTFSVSSSTAVVESGERFARALLSFLVQSRYHWDTKHAHLKLHLWPSTTVPNMIVQLASSVKNKFTTPISWSPQSLKRFRRCFCVYKSVYYEFFCVVWYWFIFFFMAFMKAKTSLQKCKCHFCFLRV